MERPAAPERQCAAHRGARQSEDVARSTSIILLPMTKAAAKAHRTEGKFFEMDGTRLDAFHCEWAVVLLSVIRAPGRSLVTSTVVALGVETLQRARTVVEKAGHQGANVKKRRGGCV